MKIGSRLWILWAASLVIFTGAAVATWLGLDLMDGVRGLTIRFLLCYCGIIVVFQALAAIDAVRSMLRESPGKANQADSAALMSNTMDKIRGSL